MVHDQSGETYNTNKQIRCKTSMSRSDLCDYSDAYIVVTGKITVTDPDNDAYDKELALKTMHHVLVAFQRLMMQKKDNAEDLDVVIPMCNLLEYSKTIEKQQAVCGIITEMNQIVVLIIITVF